MTRSLDTADDIEIPRRRRPLVSFTFQFSLGRFFEVDVDGSWPMVRFGTLLFSVGRPWGLTQRGWAIWLDRKAWRIRREPGCVTIATGPYDWIVQRVVVK